MKNLKFQILKLDNLTACVRYYLRLLTILFLFLFLVCTFFTRQNISAQNQVKTQTLSPSPFRIGERITYNISFEKFNNAAYAEIYTVSRGKLGERDAVELRAKVKTNELVSAVFYLLDESRTTFASAETGLPLYIRKIIIAQTPKTFFTFNRNARIIGNFLPHSGQSIKQSGFSGIRISSQRNC